MPLKLNLFHLDIYHQVVVQVIHHHQVRVTQVLVIPVTVKQVRQTKSVYEIVKTERKQKNAKNGEVRSLILILALRAFYTGRWL